MKNKLRRCNKHNIHDFEIKKLKTYNVSDKNEYGYVLEVDLEYHRNLTDLHNDFPLDPECIEVKKVYK